VTPAPNEGGVAAVARFGRQGYDLVIGFDYDTMVAVGTDLAKRFPRTVFALLDTSRADLGQPPRNVVGVPFESQEVGYLVGYLAGLMERRRPGKDAVGAVGGFQIDPVDRFIAGFGAGARRAAPGIRVLTDYAESFVDPVKCRRVALAQLAKGAGTVFDVAGGCGPGTLAAAKGRGRWALGVDFDRSALGPHVLTSAVKRYDVVIFELIRTLVRHRLQLGRDYRQTVANGGLALGAFSPVVPRPVRDRVRALAREIAAGRVEGIPRVPG
jgi:basic membrane protein A